MAFTEASYSINSLSHSVHWFIPIARTVTPGGTAVISFHITPQQHYWSTNGNCQYFVYQAHLHSLYWINLISDAFFFIHSKAGTWNLYGLTYSFKVACIRLINPNLLWNTISCKSLRGHFHVGIKVACLANSFKVTPLCCSYAVSGCKVIKYLIR